jgi:hypothetical protein
MQVLRVGRVLRKGDAEFEPLREMVARGGGCLVAYLVEEPPDYASALLDGIGKKPWNPAS